MSAILKKLQEFTIFEGIASHPAWHGNIPGLVAEKMLRGKKTPYLYLLRKGEDSSVENVQHYYVTFVGPDLSVRHQPVMVTILPNGWTYEQGGPGAIYTDISFDPVMHFMMHCEKGECTPLIKK